MASTRKYLELVTPSKHYSPVRQCIYCGRKGRKLGKEHIIPHGLAGDSLVLKLATCRRDGARRKPWTCSDLTNQFETACLDHMWWPFRWHLGIPSRHKRQPKEFRLRRAKVTKIDAGTIDYDRSTKTETPIAPGEFPVFYVAFKFPPPGILIRRDPRAELSWENWVAQNPDELRKHLADGEALRLAPGNVEPFCKLLAKIAHGYAVAELGCDAFNHSLVPFIRGKEAILVPQWIGGHEIVPPASTHLHEINWELVPIGKVHFVVVTIRLFAFIGTPVYTVIVGAFKGAHDQLPFLKQPIHAIDVKALPPIPQLVPISEVVRIPRV